EKKSRREEVLEKIGLSREKNELVSTLSQGFRQRLALGCAIVSRPSLLFLDEPTSGVSPTSRRSFFNLIQEMAAAGTTVIVTTHFMDEAERCDKIAFFHEGQLLSAASPDDLKKNILEGTLVQMDLPDPMKQIPKIQDLPYVKECTIHGAFLHVLLTDPSAVNTLKTFTGAESLAITPSLEDVFIALVRKQRGENQ
ncbi:MAG: ABC transporter ATP-binding protein, partial [Syntrophomonadaceae bacterium]|nr:ABC transporter ATP-binding protein [Syntrophomonadaceae bacterium]